MKRNCPKCNKEIEYKSKIGYSNGMTKNTLCNSCRNSGENNPAKRKEIREILS